MDSVNIQNKGQSFLRQNAAENGAYGKSPSYVLEGVSCFDIAQTFECGQCFRFERVSEADADPVYEGVAKGQGVSVFVSTGEGFILKIQMSKPFKRYGRTTLTFLMSTGRSKIFFQTIPSYRRPSPLRAAYIF